VDFFFQKLENPCFLAYFTVSLGTDHLKSVKSSTFAAIWDKNYTIEIVPSEGKSN
jgi:hypothetical protein